jgi:hypothetical protein
MRPTIVLLGVSLVLCGCANSDSDITAKLPAGAGQPLNPGGKPTDPGQAKFADAQNRGGQAASADINQRMKQMAQARERSEAGK